MQSVNNFNFKSIPLDLSGISFDMAEGCLTEIKEVFFIEGKYAPIIRWYSFSQSDWPKPHQILCDFWRDNGTVDKCTLNAIESNEKLAKVKPYIAIVSKKNNDYHYDFVGERFAAFHHINPEKPDTLLSLLNASQSAIDLFNYTTLAATAIRGQGLLCLYQGGTDTAPELWNKLILPIIDSKGIAEKFIMCALKSPAH
jgi:hypothetical protein